MDNPAGRCGRRQGGRVHLRSVRKYDCRRGGPQSVPVTGRENDATGLYYYHARYYLPNLARFISSDPIGLDGGITTYAYVDGNPLSMVDPYG
ncbi:RHS repeat-associated core domain-containing protein [Massilia sp. TWR1-2-2]|uniref:RHS repeat-associated core domain-containing protein n=1 Tax=Massilia sp. TWR1-2-2 TaxID=2804584 RepID=UPI003CF34846